MITGNMPIGNSVAVSVWNAITSAYAIGRVRRQSSSGAMPVSNRNPAQLIASGVHSSANSGPSSGMPVLAPSQIRSGWAWISQSLCALARPANV
jgi:hypothetical protein